MPSIHAKNPKGGFTPPQFSQSGGIKRAKLDQESQNSGKLCSQKTGAGFTLIELLIVIAILGLLASIIMVSLRNIRTNSRDTRRIADMEAIYKALEMYYQSEGKYPCRNNWNTSTDPDYLQSLVGDYLARNPKDPLNINSGGRQFFYVYDSFKAHQNGTCGQIAKLEVYFEGMDMWKDKCPLGGVWSGENHCHIWIPGPLPTQEPGNSSLQCPNNYELEWGPAIDQFYGGSRDWTAYCESLRDSDPSEWDY